MSRFEIQDILFQNQRGIVYQAIDHTQNIEIAIYRFFPCGSDSPGLDQNGVSIFLQSLHDLFEFKHPNHRNIIDGGVDSIDSIPYWFSDWVQGKTLQEVLSQRKLTPSEIRKLLYQAIELSLHFSMKMKQEGVWIETQVESILVVENAQELDFHFWISPQKYLNAESQTHNLLEFESLAAKLAGLERKLFQVSACEGLGGWIRWIRKNPKATLSAALQELTHSHSIYSSRLHSAEINRSSLKSPQKYKKNQFSRFIPLISMALSIFGLVAVGLFFSDKKHRKHSTLGQNIKLETRKNCEAISSGNHSVKLLGAKEDLITRNLVSDSHNAEELLIFRPDQLMKFQLLKGNQAVALSGKLFSISTSKSGKSFYFHFSESNENDSIKGLVQINDYQDLFSLETFQTFIGKKIQMNGTIFREPQGRFCLKIKIFSDIQIISE